jgi:GNAT superfamily N-acetyltransferase
MRVVDLSDEHKNLFFLCLEDWSDEAKEAGPKREIWFNKKREKGLRAKLALDGRGEVGGMIQFLPIEETFVDGGDLFFVHCIWVHGYKQGRGNFQGKGMGRALLQAAEDDARAAGAKGIAAWGIRFPFWMKASWFKKFGYKKADRQGVAVLLWKPFSDDAAPPKWIRGPKKPLVITPGKVTVMSFVNGWCMAMNLAYERAKRAASEFGDAVEFREIDTSDRATFLEWGIADALYIDKKQVQLGPPPSVEKIRRLIAKRVRKLGTR